MAAAFRKGVDAAYKAVMKPTEGTILTVIRKAAEAAEQIAASNNDAWAVCCAAMAAAEEALAKTPEQLPVLKKAGVVDAGGQGLVLIFQGIGAVLEKGTVVQPIAGSAVTPVQTPDKSTVAAASGEIEFGYCSEFLIEKDRHAPPAGSAAAAGVPGVHRRLRRGGGRQRYYQGTCAFQLPRRCDPGCAEIRPADQY